MVRAAWMAAAWQSWLSVLVVTSAAAGQIAAGQPVVTPAGGVPALDPAVFHARIEPIFLARRDGLQTCATCHMGKVGTRFRLVPLAEGATGWSEADSAKNLAALTPLLVPGDPLASRLLTHALDRASGGDAFHGGGKHWRTQSDAEWQAMATWVRGARAPAATAASNSTSTRTAVRIIQTNAAGDGAHLIDPDTNTVVAVLRGVDIPHGVTASPDGARLYVTNEHHQTLDVIDAVTLTVTSSIKLSGRPNNLALSLDGRKVYVGIAQAPGAVDVIDTVALKNVKSIPVKGAIHNVYVTPDGKFAVAGSIPQKAISIVDTATDAVVRTIDESSGIRPMAFTTNRDGSTKDVIVQLSDFHGFAVVDFASGKETARIEHPAIPGEHPHTDGLQGAPAHGLWVSPDGTRLWSTSKVYGYAYVHSLPDLKEVGRVFVGQHPEWVTATPDGRFVYIAAAGDNQVYVVETATLKVVAQIPVGQVPKRNATARLRVSTSR